MRAPDLSLAEHARLKEWLVDRTPDEQVQNLSRSEAAWIREARIAEHMAASPVMNQAEADRQVSRSRSSDLTLERETSRRTEGRRPQWQDGRTMDKRDRSGSEGRRSSERSG
jgi:hypothetical protein